MEEQHPSAAGPRTATQLLDDLYGDSPEWHESVTRHVTAFEIAEELYALRERHDLTQKQLAALIGSSQSAIARLENATYTGHSTAVLRRIAEAVGERVSVKFVPRNS